MNQPQLGLRSSYAHDQASLSKAAAGEPLDLSRDLPGLSDLEVRLGNRLAGPRHLMKLEAEGLAIELRLRAPAAARQAAPATGFDVMLSLNESEISFRLPAALVNLLLGKVEPGLSPGGLEPRVLALLLELSLTPIFDRLEAESPVRLAVLNAAPASSVAADRMAVEIECRCDGITAPATLFLSEASALRLMEELECRPPKRRSWEELPIPLAFRRGITGLTLAELAGLRPGDFVIFDQAAPSTDQVVVVAAERWMFLGEKLESAVKLSTGRGLPEDGNWERWTMSDGETKENPLGQSTDSEFDDLSITLCFDLGRPSTTLGELRKLDAGYVFDLRRNPSDAVDIYANGHRIGAGELVRVADSLGVRVIRLFNHG